MKFSEIESEQWESLKPYLDTCLLPLGGLHGSESPIEVITALEKLRDVLDIVEVPYKGRVVTYPAIQYQWHEEVTFVQMVDQICHQLKQQFTFVIVVTADEKIENMQFAHADMLVSSKHLDNPMKEEILQSVQQLWTKV
ncbi:DUF2487 family protein [Longirhabdus pacifica]|uniref:DUF2487 family protein n=1 Tax=Longirhabdus pacifica TaxID=2305227 RepID=UPI0010088458|nr:DUF2487 family protein [Longirhabdus pacifica]